MKRLQRDDENLSDFAFFTSLSMEKSLSQVNFGRNAENKILNFPGVKAPFSKFLWGLGVGGLYASLLLLLFM